MAQVTVDLDILTMEQMDLLDRVWERLGRDPAGFSLTPEQARELDRRDDELQEDAARGTDPNESRTVHCRDYYSL